MIKECEQDDSNTGPKDGLEVRKWSARVIG